MNERLIPSCGDADQSDPSESEAKIFYLKMKGDYLRYKAEVAPNSKKDGVEAKEGLCFFLLPLPWQLPAFVLAASS